MRLSLILAKSRNHVIGDKGQIPWHLPDDMKFFRRTTMGKPIIMGRKTFDSIGKPLPGRQNIVISGNARFIAPDGVVVVTDLDSALWAAANVDEVMVIGGAQVYQTALPMADRIYLTEIDADIDGDTTFEFDFGDAFEETSREAHAADEKHAYPYSFVVLDRRP